MPAMSDAAGGMVLYKYGYRTSTDLVVPAGFTNVLSSTAKPAKCYVAFRHYSGLPVQLNFSGATDSQACAAMILK